MNPPSFCRRKAGFRQQLLSGHRGVVDPVARSIQNFPHAFGAIQVVNENICIHDKRGRRADYLLILGHILQELFGRATIPGSYFIHMR